MKLNVSLSSSAIIITLFSLLTTAGAEQVSWNTIEYTATAKAVILGLKEDYQTTTGPPLPINASAYVDKYVYDIKFEAGGLSQVDSSVINISTWAYSCT